MIWLILRGRWSSWVKQGLERIGCCIVWHDDDPQPISAEIVMGQGEEEKVEKVCEVTAVLSSLFQGDTLARVPVTISAPPDD